MEAKDIQKEYEGYKKLNLPDFEELDKEFFITDTFLSARYKPKYFLISIKRAMSNHLWSWINYLHGIILPNPQSMIMSQETNFFSEEERAEITTLMLKIVKLIKKDLILDDITDEKILAEHINYSFIKWKELKPNCLKIAKEAYDNWEKLV